MGYNLLWSFDEMEQVALQVDDLCIKINSLSYLFVCPEGAYKYAKNVRLHREAMSLPFGGFSIVLGYVSC
jgi:hypothetical protein